MYVYVCVSAHNVVAEDDGGAVRGGRGGVADDVAALLAVRSVHGGRRLHHALHQRHRRRSRHLWEGTQILYRKLYPLYYFFRSLVNNVKKVMGINV